MTDKYQQLHQLKSLLDSGVLSQEEFDADKKKILDTPEEDKLSPIPPAKKPGFFSKEAVRQRQEAFEKLPKSEQQQQQMMGIIYAIIFGIFLIGILFFAMLFGWSGVKAGIENLWGR